MNPGVLETKENKPGRIDDGINGSERSENHRLGSEPNGDRSKEFQPASSAEAQVTKPQKAETSGQGVKSDGEVEEETTRIMRELNFDPANFPATLEALRDVINQGEIKLDPGQIKKDAASLQNLDAADAMGAIIELQRRRMSREQQGESS